MPISIDHIIHYSFFYFFLDTNYLSLTVEGRSSDDPLPFLMIEPAESYLHAELCYKEQTGFSSYQGDYQPHKSFS